MSVLVAGVGVPGVWRRTTAVVGSAAAFSVLMGGLAAPAQARTAEAVALSAQTPPGPSAGDEPLTAADVATAVTVARLEDRPVEVLSERTVSGSVFALPDGTMAAGMAAGPLWVPRGGDGTQPEDWEQLDLTLEIQDDGSVAAAAHIGDLVLSGGTSDGATVDVPTTVASLTGPEGETSSVSWTGPLPAPRLEGARAVYDDVRPGVDMVIDATPTGFEQFFVVHEPPTEDEPLSLPVTIATAGASVTEGESAALEITTPEGVVIAEAPEPTMWDAGADADRVHPVTEPWTEVDAGEEWAPPAQMWEQDAAPGGSGLRRTPAPGQGGATTDPSAEISGPQAPLMAQQVPVDRSVEAGPAGVEMELSPQAEFLGDPETAYPIVVDPAITYLVPSLDTSVQSGYTSDLSASGEMLLGTWDSGGRISRSFMTFEKPELHGRRILDARLQLFEYHSWSCQARNWRVWDTGPATTATRWTNQPTFFGHYSTSGETRGYSSACPGGWVMADVTALAQRWADNAAAPLVGIGLTAENESDNYGWKRFYSSESGGDVMPRVWVHYDTVPNTPFNIKVSPGTVSANGVQYVNTRTPRLSATVGDDDGDSLTAVFQLLHDGVPIAEYRQSNVPHGGTAYWDIPSTMLGAGLNYSFRVCGIDGILQGGWATSPTFQLDTTAPGAPTVSSVTYPSDGSWNGAENQAGTFTFTAPGFDPSFVGYRWALGKAPDPAQTPVAGPTVSITPTAPGRQELQVQAVDRAGNTSAIVKYAFNVGRAGIISPQTASHVVRRARLYVTAHSDYSTIGFQWRRSPDSGEWQTITGGQLSTGGVEWAGSSGALDRNGFTTWDAGATLGFAGGPVEVRAVLSGAVTSTYYTTPITLVVDADADGAATAPIGPGTVNLLTGDHGLTATDVEEFGLSVVRAASSRDTDIGYQLQTERLSTAAREGTDATLFNGANATVSVAADKHHAGTTSVKLTGSGYAAANLTNAAPPIRGGRTYRVSAWIFVPSTGNALPTGGTATAMTMKAMTIDPVSGQWVNVAGAATTPPTAANGWQQVSFDVTVPSSSPQLLLILNNGLPGSQSVYWDDFSVKEVFAPFGPQWSLGTADGATGTAYTRITRPEPDVAAVQLTGGGEIWFTSSGGVKWHPQPGAEDLTLTATSTTTWRLSELDGTYTDFAQDAATNDYPVQYTSPPPTPATTTSGTRYVYDTTALPGISRLVRIIAPVEPGVDGWPDNKAPCTSTPLMRGCEVLDLTYAPASTPIPAAGATGAYPNRITQVSASSYDPTTAAIATTAVATYGYDSTGRLTQVQDPRLVAAGSQAQVTTYEYDTAGRITSVSATGELPYTFTYGAAGAARTANGDWVDPAPARLLKVSRNWLLEGTTNALGQGLNTTTVVYDVPLSRAQGGPYNLDAAAVATWAQTDAPTTATAVFGPQSDDPQVTTATATTPGRDGYRAAEVHYLNGSGLEVNTASPAGPDAPIEGFIDTAEYDRHGNTTRTLDATNRLLALGKLPGAASTLSSLGVPAGTPAPAISRYLDTRSTYSVDGLDLLSQTGPTQVLRPAGQATERPLRPVTINTYDQGKPDGAAYHLVTTTRSFGIDPYVQTSVEYDPIITTTEYSPVDGAAPLGGASGWVHKQPTRITIDAQQPTATSSTVIYDERGRVISSSKPGSNGSDAATTVTVYWTAGPNLVDASCGGRPEWTGQPCLTKAPGAVTGHDPTRMATNLPVRRVEAYNRWGSPTIVSESVTGPLNGQSVTQTRTTTTGYDAADRVTTVAMTGTDAGQAISTTRTVYDPATAEVVRVDSLDDNGAVTSSITKQYDALGRLTRYTDANGAWTTTTYDRYGKPITETQGIGSGATAVDLGTKTFTYDHTTEPRGYLTAISDSVAGTITATWGPDGQLTSQALPGGVRLDLTYDPARVPVQRTYTRLDDPATTTDETAPIWSDAVVENHRGQWVQHTSNHGTRTYTYDRLGRLTGVNDTDLTGACTTRAYGFAGNPRTNRTQYATATAAPGDPCPTAQLATTATYDTADRLTNPGWVYDPLGRITTMPTDTGAVVNEYFVNDLIYSQTQDGVSRTTWSLDPLHRRTTNVIDERVGGVWERSATKVSHYANDSDEPAWIAEDITLPSDVTRYVSGVEGDIALTTTITGHRELQLIDLHGDVVGTLPIADEAAQATWSALQLTRSDEFGNPIPLTGAGATTGPPARYGWLGAAQRSAEALGGVILMGVRLYSPATGRFLSVDPVPGGSANAYDYCNADPVNCTDLAGTFSWKGLIKAVAVVGEVASMIPGPIGAAAGAISAVAYAADGNTVKALEMGVTAAAALVGAGAVVKAAAAGVRAVRTARAIATTARAGGDLSKFGTVGRATSQLAGRMYVGRGARWVGAGKNRALYSRDMTLRFRSASAKAQENRFQANFERSTSPGTALSKWKYPKRTYDGHLNVRRSGR